MRGQLPGPALSAAPCAIAISSALRYRAPASLVDQLLAEMALSGADLNGLTGALRPPRPSGPITLATRNEHER